MLSQAPEYIMHRVRWLTVCGWCFLILSLFHDPFTAWMTVPSHATPFSDPMVLPGAGVEIQGQFVTAEAYAIGARIFWGMVIPVSVVIVFVLGHETWRRICPLYFFSQIPRALGLKPRLDIAQNRWLQRNHLFLQFALFFMGLCARLLFINSDRLLLGLFLLFTLLCAALIVFLYGGRSWCHYFCPFGMVQTVLTGPRGLLDSAAHQVPAASITQSMCRTVEQGTEKSACVNCKSPCFDIDSEKSYWEQLRKPGRKLIQYGYLGLVIGYFAYYWLYAGNFDYYFSGMWSHEPHQLSALLHPGFYLFNHSIAIPKLIAVPMTLLLFVIITCMICSRVELNWRQHDRSVDYELIVHRMFTACTFLAVNIFFIYGGRPEILRLPLAAQFSFQSCVVLVSTLWLTRSWNRSADQYMKESMVDKLRRQLKKLALNDAVTDGRSLNQLSPDEIYILAKTLPGVTQQDHHRICKGVLQELLQAGHLQSSGNLAILRHMRQILEVSDEQYYELLRELGSEPANAHLFYPESQQPQTHLRKPYSADIPQTLIRQNRRN